MTHIDSSHHIATHHQAPVTNTAEMTLPASELSLVKLDPPDTSPRAIIKETFDLIQSRPNESVGYGVALLALNMGLNGLVQMGLQAVVAMLVVAAIGLMQANEALGIGVLLGGGSLSFLFILTCSLAIQSMTMGGYQLLWLKMLRDEPMTLDDVKEIRTSIWPLVGAGLLSTLAIALGGSALILPGVVLALGFILHPFFIIDKRLGAIESLKASWIATRGHKINLFLLLLFMLVANTLGMLACGIGLFVSYPLSLGCLAAYYNRIATPGRAYLLDSIDHERTLDQDPLPLSPSSPHTSP